MQLNYKLTATVTRSVKDTIDINVKALTKDEAREVAERVLSVYPQSHDEKDVPMCYVSSREYGGVDILEITDRK